MLLAGTQKGSMLHCVLVTSVCVTLVTWTPWDLCVTGWPTEGKHVALCVSDLSLCYSGYMDTIGSMCYWLTYRRKHVSLCVSDLSLNNMWLAHREKHVALCVSDLSLCCSGFIDTMQPMCCWLAHREKHVALCISDLSLCCSGFIDILQPMCFWLAHWVERCGCGRSPSGAR